MGLKCTISGKLKPSSIDYLLKLFGEIMSAALSNDSLAKPAPAAPDADGFLTVGPYPPRARSAYFKTGCTASVMRGRDSYQPSNAYAPQR
jgi:hypothetical protein